MTEAYDPNWMDNLPQYSPWKQLNLLLNMLKNPYLTEKGQAQVAVLILDVIKKIDEKKAQKKAQLTD